MWKRWSAITLLLALPLVGSGPAVAADGDEPTRVVVVLREAGAADAPSLEQSSDAQRTSTVDRLQDAVLDDLAPSDADDVLRYEHLPALAMTVPDAEAIERLEANPNVLRVDATVGGSGSLLEVRSIMGIDTSYANGFDGDGVTAAVLDTGIDSDHPDLVDDVVLAGQACFGADGGTGFCANGTSRQTGAGAAEDLSGHGTHVAGIISSNGTQAPRGVAPDVDIVAIRVLDDCSFAGCFYDASEIVAALDYVIAHPELGIDLVNLSLGTNLLFPSACDTATSWTIAGAAAVDTLRASGVMVFAAAGNSGSSSATAFPACLSNVISVGNSTDGDSPAGSSNSNANTDVFAPGTGVVSSLRGGGTISATGTSMASPAALGCAALLIESGQATTPDAIETRLETSPTSVIVGASGLSFPRVQCALAPTQYCDGEVVTVDLSQGQSPTAGNDVILGTAGPDLIGGLGGDDLICGGEGDDIILGHGGNDTLHGDNGSDYLWGGDDTDTYHGGDGIDYLDGGLDNTNAGETMHGDDGNDIILGHGGNDTLHGDNGSDYLWGGDDTDTLDGGPDVDTCDGAAGAADSATGCEFVIGVP